MKKAARLALQPILERARESSLEANDDSEDEEPEPEPERKKRGKSTKRSSKPAEKKTRRKSTAKRGREAKSSSSSRSKKGAEEDDSPLMKASSGKAKRNKADARRLKGSYRQWASDEIEDLKETLRELCSPTLHGLMFNRDFQKNVKAIDMLINKGKNMLIRCCFVLVDSHACFCLFVCLFVFVCLLLLLGLTEFRDEIDANVDYILRWVSWKMCDANTSVLLKSLDFLQSTQ